MASYAIFPKGFFKLFIVGYCWTQTLKFILEHGQYFSVELVPMSMERYTIVRFRELNSSNLQQELVHKLV